MKRRIFSGLNLLVVSACLIISSTQSAFCALSFTIDNMCGPTGSEVVVAVRTSDFDSIGSIQGTIQFNPALVSFVQIEEYNLPSDTFGIGGFNLAQAATGKIMFLWLAPFDSVSGISLPDRSIIFSIRFSITGSLNQQDSIKFSDTPVPLEFSDYTLLNTINAQLTDGCILAQDCGAKLSLKAFLGGPFDTSSVPVLMYDSLRTKNYIPLNEPYTGIFSHYSPGGTESINASVLQVTGNNAIVDWVFVELRNVSDTDVVATRSALIQRDGDVVDLDGVSSLSFPKVPYTNYFISIRHRNHFGVMARDTSFLDTLATSIDFTSIGTLTYGTNAQSNKAGKMVMWAGNTFTDSVIKYSGANNDRAFILAKIGGSTPLNTLLGYYLEDVNMNGIVRYSGASNDRAIILGNIGSSTPTNTLIQRLP